MQLIFATNNENKLIEIKHKIPNYINLLSLEDINFIDEPDENGATFAANALIKAKSIWQKLLINCFAEDSGLVVEELNGNPGINSSIYSGERNDKKNIEKVLNELNNKENRNAYFTTIIALIIENKEYIFEGKITGKITLEPIGNNGFGYDSIFIPTGFNKTFAQFTIEEKSKISHRGIALNKLVNFIANYGN
ncbi:MAG: RdgB/HAM1 family non-canonical purine NTP pyrophosphatase [Solirubrobacteraceae bacterium]